MLCQLNWHKTIGRNNGLKSIVGTVFLWKCLRTAGLLRSTSCIFIDPHWRIDWNLFCYW